MNKIIALILSLSSFIGGAYGLYYCVEVFRRITGTHLGNDTVLYVYIFFLLMLFFAVVAFWFSSKKIFVRAIIIGLLILNLAGISFWGYMDVFKQYIRYSEINR